LGLERSFGQRNGFFIHHAKDVSGDDIVEPKNWD
jgi:hypothetical protein